MNTIRIVDDDVYIGDMLEEILTKEGYQRHPRDRDKRKSRDFR